MHAVTLNRQDAVGSRSRDRIIDPMAERRRSDEPSIAPGDVTAAKRKDTAWKICIRHATIRVVLAHGTIAKADATAAGKIDGRSTRDDRIVVVDSEWQRERGLDPPPSIAGTSAIDRNAGTSLICADIVPGQSRSCYGIDINPPLRKEGGAADEKQQAKEEGTEDVSVLHDDG